MSAVRAHGNIYPNGVGYIDLIVSDAHIGSADICAEGGYVVFGRRKPVATLAEAAEQCLIARINRKEKEIAGLKILLSMVTDELFTLRQAKRKT